MSYTISGTTNASSRIISINTNVYSVESTKLISANEPYSIDSNGNNKIIISRATSGEIVGFGGVSPTKTYYGNDIGLFAGGENRNNSNTVTNNITYINISTTGNAQFFGYLTLARSCLTATSNGANNRGIFIAGSATGYTPYYNTIDYVTISSAGNATDFGDTTTELNYFTATSNNTNNRGIIVRKDFYNYVTISTAANASTYGSLTVLRSSSASFSNGTNNRGLIYAGNYSSTRYNTIDYYTITSTSNASDFGDATVARNGLVGFSNLTNNRGIAAGGYNGTVSVNTIDYVTISSTGNAIDFGDLLYTGSGASSMSNGLGNIGVIGGINLSNIINYVMITSLGNACAFGELTMSLFAGSGTSNA